MTRRNILICLGLVMLNLIGFWPVGGLDFILLDDGNYVTENANVQGGITPASVVWAFSTTHAANWHPITWLSHMLDCELFGLEPGGPHWVNLGLHIANTLLLFIVLNQMTSAAGSLGSRGGATWLTGPSSVALLRRVDRSALPVWRSALVAALFAVHPLHVQSVAWISERKDVLSGVFFFLTLWAYARYAQGVGNRAQSGKAFNIQHSTSNIQWYYWSAVCFFALGLMCKPMLVTVPFVLLLLDVWPLRRIAEGGVRSAELENAVHPSAPNSLAQRSEAKTAQFPGAAERSEDGSTLPPSPPAMADRQLSTVFLEKVPFLALVLISCILTLKAQGQGGAIQHVWWLRWYMRVLVAPVFCTAYLGKMFWPINLSIFDPYTPVYTWQMVGAGLLIVGLSVFCLRQVRARTYLFTGWFWFLVMLVPVIGLVQVGAQSMADRYTYLPSIGVFMAVAWGLGEIAANSRIWRTGVTLAATAAVLACLLDTRHQLRYWRSNFVLFSHGLEVAPVNNTTCYYCLGLALWKTGDVDGAIRKFRAALKISPDFTEASSRLGFLLLQQDKPAEAEAEFKDVLRSDPSDTKAHKYLGDALAAQGKLAEAEAEYDTVLRLNPDNAAVSEGLKPDLEKLATARTLTNLYEKLKAQPTAEAHAQLAAIRASQGGYQEAVDHYSAALRLKPDAPDILNDLAWLLATCPDDRIRNGTEAVQYAERACELTQRQQALMLGTLAAAYAEAGRFDDAVAAAQRACDLATQQGDSLLLQKNEALLEIYRGHKPWRE